MIIDRRRRPSAGRKYESKAEAAARMGVSLHRYRRWESDAGDPPKVPVGDVKDCEACVIYRHRAGVSIDEVARKLQVTRNWISEMESGRGNCSRLMGFWSGRRCPWRPRRPARMASSR